MYVIHVGPFRERVLTLSPPRAQPIRLVLFDAFRTLVVFRKDVGLQYVSSEDVCESE
jgi:hypothetical protein